MYTNRYRERVLTLGLLALTLGMSQGAWCEDTAGNPAGEVTPPPTRELPLQEQVDQLTAHIAGMESKLRESAGARKAADQARMDAERRLATCNQTVDDLHQRLELFDKTQTQLEQTLGMQVQEVSRLNDQMQLLMRMRQDMEQHLRQILAVIPESEGGNLTPAQAEQAANEAFLHLHDLYNHGNDQDPGMAQKLADARDQLYRQQFLLARVHHAQGLYRVRDHDSLADISTRFYGTSGRWQMIFEANRHLMQDPDELMPGMTLIIP